MTRMVRPMKINDEQGDSITIDALKVTDFDVSNCMLTIDAQYQEHLHFPSKSNSEIFRMFNAKLYNALNAPVKVTYDLLEAMGVEGNYMWLYATWALDKKSSLHSTVYDFKECRWLSAELNRFLNVGDYIQANCPLSFQVLLQFYTDGTPVKGKETE